MFLNKKTLALRLIDFGLALGWNQDLKKEIKWSVKATGSVSIIISKVYYVSPEVIANNYS
jgi:hypothetical protein